MGDLHDDIEAKRNEIMDDIVDMLADSGQCEGCMVKQLLPAMVGYAIWFLDVHEKQDLEDFWKELLTRSMSQAAAIELQVLQKEVDEEKTVH